MRNPLSIALCALLSAASADAEPRTFTNTAGKAIEAELVRVEGTDAILKLANNNTAKVAISSLSKPDEEFIKAWWEKNKDKVGPMEVSLTIDKNTERIDRKVTKSAPTVGGNNNTNQPAPTVTKMQKDEIEYACVLKSYSQKDISNITVAYTIYKRVITRDKDGSKSVVEEIEGTETINLLEAHGSAPFETDALLCQDDSKTGGIGPDTRRSETIEGVVFTLSAGGAEFLKQSYPENYIERLEEEQKREEDKPLR